jgi:hypothetical protein
MACRKDVKNVARAGAGRMRQVILQSADEVAVIWRRGTGRETGRRVERRCAESRRVAQSVDAVNNAAAGG